MSDDIVDRLLHPMVGPDGMGGLKLIDWSILDASAKEIERLRAENAALYEICAEFASAVSIDDDMRIREVRVDDLASTVAHWVKFLIKTAIKPDYNYRGQ